MADIADFHPLMQAALRTGKLPGDEEIARAVGETAAKISRLRADLANAWYPFEEDQMSVHPPPDKVKTPLDMDDITHLAPGALGPTATTEMAPGWFAPDASKVHESAACLAATQGSSGHQRCDPDRHE